MGERSPRRLLEMAAGFGLAALLLWVFFHDVSWDEVFQCLDEADPGLLLLCSLGHALVLLVRSLRWRVLLQPLKPELAIGPAWRFFTIGFVVSSLLPGRMGELLRPMLLARDQELRFAPVFATVVTERVVDLLAVLLLLGIGFISPGALGSSSEDPAVAEAVSTLNRVGLVTLSMALGVGFFLTFLKVRTESALRIVEWVSRPLPGKVKSWAHDLTQNFAEGIGSLEGLRQSGLFIGATAATWLIIALANWAALAAFDIERPLLHILFLTAVLSLGAAVPTPAGTGTFHAGAILVVGVLWGLNDSAASTVAAFAISCHVASYVPAVLFGVISLLREGIHLRTLTRASPLSEPDEHMR